jgi:bifunctional NMN adenylyltransferase/nudix hydrolase
MNLRTTDVGVIVGRFQTAKLHDAHVDLIKTVCARHAKVIIFLGLSPIVATKNNPLDFESRKRMIQEIFPEVTILYINDNQSNDAWSKNLDRMLADSHLTGVGKTVTLYGSRDSFIRHYKGKHTTEELIPERTVSATEMRKLSGNSVKSTADFREGVIWATQNRYPTTYPTVDVAAVDFVGKRVLLGKKAGEEALRFMGGFADPTDPTYEFAAARELSEEANIKIDPEQFIYIGSAKIDDWRYRAEVDQIKTLLFIVNIGDRTAQAGDDIAETQWVPINDNLKSLVMPLHHKLVDLLLKDFKARGF